VVCTGGSKGRDDSEGDPMRIYIGGYSLVSDLEAERDYPSVRDNSIADFAMPTFARAGLSELDVLNDMKQRLEEEYKSCFDEGEMAALEFTTFRWDEQPHISVDGAVPNDTRGWAEHFVYVDDICIGAVVVVTVDAV